MQHFLAQSPAFFVGFYYYLGVWCTSLFAAQPFKTPPPINKHYCGKNGGRMHEKTRGVEAEAQSGR